MDSLSQIVLGASVAEASLGSKIGNKALLFGTIGGTIPDLDVFVGSWLFGNEIDAMLFHRGFMHSILFSVLAAFVFGWVTFKLYNTYPYCSSEIPNSTFKSPDRFEVCQRPISIQGIFAPILRMSDVLFS